MKSLVTCNFIPDVALTVEEIIQALSTHVFDREVGFGVRNVEHHDGIVQARLIKISYSYIFDYNDETNEIEKKQISVVNEIDFVTDLKERLICIIGPVSNVAPVKLLIKTVFKGKVSVRPYKQTILELCNKLTSKSIHFNYLSIAIDNFKYLDGVIGKFSGTALNDHIVAELIETYKTDVQRLGIAICLPDYEEPVKIIVSGMGLLKIECEPNNFDEIFDNLKTLLYT